jgi:hypothetical protein
MGSRLSYNVHAQVVPDRNRLLKHLEKIKPAAVLVMDGLGLCQEIKAMLPDTTVISRIFPDEDIQNRATPENWFEHRAPHAEGGIYQYTSNEAGFSPNLIEWHERLLAMAIKHRVPLVIGNMSVGTPAPEDWAAGKHLLGLLDQHRDLFIMGLHEYACGVITSGFLGGHPDNAGVAPHLVGQGRNLIGLDQWPSREEATSMTMFHCGRFKFLVNYCQSVGIKPPRIILTEHGFDDVSDIKPWSGALKMTPPYTSIRGWKSAQDQWRDWYQAQGWSPQRALFEQLAYADRNLYQGSSVEAQLLFCWGHSSDMWDQFDLANADEFQALLEDYAQQAQVTAPIAHVASTPTPIQPTAASPGFAAIGVRPEDVAPAQQSEPTAFAAFIPTHIGDVHPFDQPESSEREASPAAVLDIMTEEDVTVIASGFRAAASSGIFSPVIADGFARWADVLERYHASKWGVG